MPGSAVPRLVPPPITATRRVAAILLASVLGAAGAAGPGTDVETAGAELAALRERIAALVERIDADRMARDEIASLLRRTERRAGELQREARALEGEIARRRERLAALERERARQRGAVERERAALARHVRAAYVIGREDHLKLLLNQEDPAALSRLLAYHGYVARARARRVEAFRAEMRRLRAVEARIREQERALAATAARKARALGALEAEKATRREALARLDAAIGDGTTRVARLRADERKLEELVRELERELADIPRALDQRRPFETLRGRLPWPADGPVQRRFGTRRENSGLTWQGVTISAEGGAAVRAVFHGRVAFADWLRGFGLLVIVDHGDGWMTLYGHNRSLYREVGDWVEAGEKIATVGDSGGRREAGLYFEIRHRGRPVNPGAWCGRETTEGDRAALVTPE